MSFGENVGFYRKQLKITQEELAERLDVSRQTVSRWETDSTFPDVETVIKLCETFGCDMDTLVRKNAKETVEAPVIPPIANTSADLASYDRHMTLFARMIALGVGFVIFGVALMLLIWAFGGNELWGLVVLFGCIAASVANFIIMGISHGNFMREHPHMCLYPAEAKARFYKKMPLLIAAATLLIFIGIIALIVMCYQDGTQIGFTEDTWSYFYASIFLFLLSGSVCIYVHTGISDAKYNVKEYNESCAAEGYTEDKEISKSRRISDTVSSVIMMTATVTFLLCGFLGNLWHPAWVAFPVGGICCGIASVIIETVLKERQ